mgnify:CR=1 FL=1
MKKLYQLIQQNCFLFSKKILPKPKGPLPIITISREMGSGGKAIANLVAQRLGKPWKVYHHEIIDEIAKEARLEKELVRSIDEKKLPLVDEFVLNIFGRRFLSFSGYYRHLVKVLSLIGQRGHAIIIGRGANFLFPHSLKVRVVCEMEQRITWEMTYEHISRQEAIKRVQKSDQERKEFVQTLYNHDHRKAHHYDLVVRTGSNLGIEDAADIIIDLARRKFKI